jgi:hypothetical protein
MPKLEYFIVCRSIQLDINTDEVSFINVLEDISPDEFPNVIYRAMAVSLWNLEPDEEDEDYQAVLVVRIAGKPDAKFAMNFSHQVRRCRAIQGVLEIPVDGPGDIEFEVLLNGEHAATHTVRIHPPGVRKSSEGEQIPNKENAEKS